MAEQNPEQNSPEPPFDENTQWSSPAGGDSRDPKPVGELVSEALTKVQEYADDPALYGARQKYIELKKRRDAGEAVDPNEFDAAQAALLREEERVRKLPPEQ